MNVTPGSIVALRADYSVDAIAALFAILARPAVAALIPREGNTFLYLQHSRAARLLDFASDGEHRWHLLPPSQSHPLVDELRATHEGGVILFTSGSTSFPKAALHSIEKFLHKFAEGRGRPFRTMALLLFDHVAGLDTLFYTLTHGGTLILTRRRDPKSILDLIESHRVEVLPTSPSFLRILCASADTGKRDLLSLKVITYGSEVMDPSTLARVNATFPNVAIIQKYGTTEIGSPRTISRSNDSLWLKFRNSELETRIVDGVLWMRSEGTILGYLNAPSPIAGDGWYCTGDFVEVDGDWIRFTGRTADIINVGGRKVSPMEVEQTILELAFVQAAVVFGEPHTLLGQVVAARVLLTAAPQDQKKAARCIRQHCRERLPPYKAPIRIDIVTEGLLSGRHKARRTAPSNPHIASNQALPK